MDLLDKDLIERVRLLVEEHKRVTGRVVSFRVGVGPDKVVVVGLVQVYLV